jgi:hypothetical protein
VAFASQTLCLFMILHMYFIKVNRSKELKQCFFNGFLVWNLKLIFIRLADIMSFEIDL